MNGPLPTRYVLKPWGRDTLPAPFASRNGERVGEIWFEPSAGLPDLLVKYLFTSEALSVQVHPSDTQTLDAHGSRQGKEECWLILSAEPGATLGIGFKREITAEEMLSAAQDGSIEDLMAWHPVAPGDFFYIPANTVHAIGAGICLIEVQQNSDITYRLYDYGRPRELHLDESIAVARGAPYPVECRKFASPGETITLVDGPVFLLDQVAGAPSETVTARYPGPLLIIPQEGDIEVGGQRVLPGSCAQANSIADVDFVRSRQCLLAAPSRRSVAAD